MVFVEAPAFSRHIASYLTDDQYRGLHVTLAANPEAGAVMPQAGGLRKLRWADSRRGKGTRGGLRLIYVHFAEEAQIWLMTLYGKDELEDLTADQKRDLKAALDAERRERAGRRRSALEGPR